MRSSDAHVLEVASQNIPVDNEQSVPHLQLVAAVLGVWAAVFSAQVVGGRSIHLLVCVEASQYILVAIVQSVIPHLQLVPAVFDVMPLVFAQVVKGRGEQELEDSTQ